MLNGITPRDRQTPNSPLLYELTSLRPGTVGREWVKTIGHLHDLAPDGLGYPEAYEVVSGEALFLLFRAPAPEGGRVVPPLCVIVEASPGDLFVIPPGWHHLAVNPGGEAMVFADVVGRSVVPDYSALFEHRGAPVYLMPNEVRRNPRWATMPVTRISCTALGDTLPATHTGLANAYFTDREAFDYLLNPASYTASWARFDDAVASAPSEPVTAD
jgi:glucose-6-phosphate isomerase